MTTLIEELDDEGRDLFIELIEEKLRAGASDPRLKRQLGTVNLFKAQKRLREVRAQRETPFILTKQAG